MNSQDESMVRPERPHKRIDLNESELHQYSQQAHPNTTRSAANNPAPFTPQQPAEASQRSQQLSLRAPAESQEGRHGEEHGQVESPAESPDFNHDAATGPVPNPFEEE